MALPIAAAVSAANPLILDAAEFGLRGDGCTDDGPILRTLVAAARAEAGPKRMVFPTGARVLIKSGVERYALRLDKMENLTIEGRESSLNF